MAFAGHSQDTSLLEGTWPELEGELVEICGLDQKLPITHRLAKGEAFAQLEIVEVSAAEAAEFPHGIEANGLQGRCDGWEADASLYRVVTFEGLVLWLPEEKLRRFQPEEDDFDAAWPGRLEDYDAFTGSVLDALLRKGHCLVQMFGMGKPFREEALSLASQREDCRVLEQELESSYLGEGCTGRVAQLSAVPMGCLEHCDEVFTTVGQLLEPVALDALHFECSGRSSSLLRVPRGDDPGDYAITKTDVEEGVVEGLLHFLRRRKVCMLCIVADDGGEISFTPKQGLGWSPSKLSVKGNQLLLFRHDLMTYSYTMSGGDESCLAVQSWLYSQPLSLVYDHVEGGDTAEDRRLVLGAHGPAQPTGESPHVRAIAVRLSGNSDDSNQEWCMICVGTDGLTAWPRTRWDQDVYYEADEQYALMTGKSYNNHGAFLNDEHIICFDNDFFGYTAEGKAEATGIEQRIMLEVGYECLFRAGRRKADLRGAPVGMITAVYQTQWLELGAKNEYLLSGYSSMQTAACTAQFVGTKGPIVRVDTACSSSLVATATADHDLRMRREGAANLVQAVMSQNDPFGWGGLCAMGMLSKKGRCFTFDNASDGFAKGEGCGAVYMEFEGKEEGRWATLAGSAINQDGRSASMTAPNGPSQREMTRSSMDVARISPADLSVSECHGTGTALGDPIEVGALRAAMDGFRSDNNPILLTTVKCNLAHMEANAGISGVIKVTSMLKHQAVPECVHVKSLNPHLDMDGFPWYIITEFVDPARTDMYIGVQGFGMGGTNARCDFWGRTSESYRNPSRRAPKQQKADFSNIPCPRCLGPMCWLCGVATPKYHREHGEHHCSLLRAGAGAYELAYDWCSTCFIGAGGVHTTGELLEEIPSLYDLQSRNIKLFAVGTWSAYSTFHELEEISPGIFSFAFELGETQREQFHFVLSRDHDMAYYPIAKNAGMNLRINGPDDDLKDRHWLVDGKESGHPSGTVFAVSFKWDESSGMKNLSWTAVEDVDSFPDRIRAGDYSHNYYVSSSWLGTRHEPLELINADEGLYRTTFRIGTSGREEYQLLRDDDGQQSLHPPHKQCHKLGTPAKGPDDMGENKNWLVAGQPGEEVRLELRVLDGTFIVTTKCRSQTRRWESSPVRHDYYLVGSFNKWVPEQMVPDEDKRGRYCCTVTWDVFTEQEFQVVVDQDPEKVMYPASAGASSGGGLLLGPDDGGEGKNWKIVGWPGTPCEIVLDLGQEDRRKMVQWGQLLEDDAALEE